MTLVETARLTGDLLVNGEWITGAGGEIRAVDPASGEAIEPAFSMATADLVPLAAEAAHQAFPIYRKVSLETRAKFLRTIADNLQAASGELVERGVNETGLTAGRLTGEVGRTAGQLRLFAKMLESGDIGELRVDPARSADSGHPRADIRQRQVPVGPVAVFGASNFPLAFGNVGGDTAAALAAGCPVIVKSHQAHPGVAELVSRIVDDAVKQHGLPSGTYQALLGSGREVGTKLVEDPRIKSVGFTGSRSGGLALLQVAQRRPEPIPVFAEMSSINPVFVMPTAASTDLAEEFVASLTLGSGQFCTNPGLIFVPVGDAGDAFVDAAVASVNGTTGQTMLTPGISEAFRSGCDALGQVAKRIAQGREGSGPNAPAPALFETTAEAFLAEPVFSQEVFGAAGLIVRYADATGLPEVARQLEGQLTATIHLGESAEDTAVARDLIEDLELRVGRVLVGGWPTGVEVGYTMVHGGPYPSSSEGRTTSVGARAIERFIRPVAYQNLPQALMPEPLQDEHLERSVRLVDGELVSPGSQ